ncbi:hypothetical protein SERLA73DRAFT_72717 [Serpula lacrymans var. lacrymans S7.3]|uniref:N-acetyltransferase domain-containing protein n=2 Tax=Serpula lacrymans var. lacrymans TaxID=341189 RepID=F8PWE3_SERL3|nr:uncharacterized protein SERLADRAFT_437247 [Serpula lacrymans var. lacrymans S7.9]EGN99948.1 hypothetical protein SERLA73DRAFT_72717 [Serpula lacrymans var. lacrymans S7.3]EGO25513.1 hypothetical protein SERLADRAFT_437247 [Serpula lacrymans var. lacrymans S7.9]
MPIAFVSVAIQRATEDLPLPSLYKCPVSPDKETPAPLVTILTLGVSPSYQCQGIVRALVRLVTSRLCSSSAHSSPPNVFPRSIPAATVIVAQVATSNTAGQEFYHRLGLQTEQELRGVYKTLGSGQKDAYLIVGQITV